MPLSLGGNGVISGIDWAGTGGGLAHITTSSFSAASTVSVDGCFTSAYDTYRVVIEATGSGVLVLRMRMRSGATDDTSSNYYNQYLNSGSTTVSAAGETAQTSMRIGTMDTPRSFIVMDVSSPAISRATTLISWEQYRVTAPETWQFASTHNVATAYDGFSLITSTGTITGTVRVYGYIND